MQNDFERLTKYLTNNYAQLFQQIAREGKGGIKSALIEYLAIWENATPQDQANLAQIWPRLDFFYNSGFSLFCHPNPVILHITNYQIKCQWQ